MNRWHAALVVRALRPYDLQLLEQGPPMPHLLFLGYGYCARVLARQLHEEGWQLSGTSRSAERLAALEADHVRPWQLSPDRPLDREAFRSVTHALISIPPDEKGDLVARLHGEEVAQSKSLSWLGLLSTTGVYGDHGGAWVTEDSPLQPSNDRSAQRVLAESQWLDLWRERGVPAHIFRVAGIYGPGRNPLDQVRAGKATRIVRRDLALGRIHVADIAGILRASMSAPRAGAVYNVVDDLPVPPQDITTYACELLGVAPPPEISYERAEMPPLMREFYSDLKLVSNARIKQELGYQLRYPTYRDGLRDLLGAQLPG